MTVPPAHDTHSPPSARMNRRTCLKTMVAAAIGGRVLPSSILAAEPAATAREFKTRFVYPKAIALDARGNVYVGCCGGFCGLQKFVPSADGAVYRAAWDIEKHKIRGIAFTPVGALCATAQVGDEHMVRMLTPDGHDLKTWGAKGTADGQFCGPTGIAVNRAGDVFVVESSTWPGGGGQRIQKFGADGAFKTKWGCEGAAPGQFNLPTGIALDHTGNVLVADSYNCRVQRFTPDGRFVGAWGTPGDGPGEFNCPQGIAVGPNGSVFIADTYNNRIQQFTAAGTFIAQWGSRGSGQGELWLPCGIAVDAAGRIYVADTFNNRVQILAGLDRA
jgi:DNA-binding beta-propeller fold protein YncE